MPGNQHRHVGRGAAGRQGVDDLLAEHPLLLDALDVDHGAVPVTVIVSSTAPTRMSMSIVAVSEPESSSPSRLTVLKPASVNVTVYAPGRRSTIRYWPSAVSDDGAHLFDQRRAGRLDRDARQHGARGIPDHAGNRGLRPGGRGNQHEQSEGEQPANGDLFSHGTLLSGT